MKKTISILLILMAVIYGCRKNDVNPPAAEVLSYDDSLASAAMTHELRSMHEADDSMMNTPHLSLQHHWDSVYHHHDSLYWHHHNMYHHGNYAHDDHTHQWVPYDHSVNHVQHAHHPYPDHPNDTLITIPNEHTHDNTNQHHPGHDINQHHNLDSLHQEHTLHHP